MISLSNKNANNTRAKTTCQREERRTQAYTTYLVFVQSIKIKELSVKEKLERLDVCLHYQVYPTIIDSSVLANGPKML
jgi:hypothetical protein